MTLAILAPRDDNPDGRDQPQATGSTRESGQNERTQRSRQAVPDEEQCLAALNKLPGLVALGILKPAQANAIRATYSEILRHHQRNQSRENQQGPASVDLLDAIRKQPELISLLEPLLSQEQIDLLMAEFAHDRAS